MTAKLMPAGLVARRETRGEVVTTLEMRFFCGVESNFPTRIHYKPRPFIMPIHQVLSPIADNTVRSLRISRRRPEVCSQLSNRGSRPQPSNASPCHAMPSCIEVKMAGGLCTQMCTSWPFFRLGGIIWSEYLIDKPVLRMDS